jgi:hypothetical protein
VIFNAHSAWLLLEPRSLNVWIITSSQSTDHGVKVPGQYTK